MLAGDGLLRLAEEVSHCRDFVSIGVSMGNEKN